ncbi:GNAT family N-acetyltransferase [Nonomuraea endophytica]|uniref:GNAT family N-acetyltransferase n=1 Tax=Nonomuraea endophytica TaxID=714136 RepID=UPI0037C6D294
MGGRGDGTIRTAGPGDRDALYALWAGCFDAPHIVPLYESDPGRHERTFVVPGPGGLLACVYYLPRPIRDGRGGVLRVGGIANVATRPDARGQGHVRRLLAAAMAAMAADGCAWSLLFTGTPAVYSGWRSFELPLVSGPLAVPGGVCAPLRGAVPEELAGLHEAHNRRRPLTTVRDLAHWRVRVPLWYGELLRTDDAYAAVRWHADELEILEVAGDLETLMPALAGEALRRGIRRARARLAGDDPAVPYLLARVRRDGDRTGMARAVLADPDPVVRAPGAAHWPADYF